MPRPKHITEEMCAHWRREFEADDSGQLSEEQREIIRADPELMEQLVFAPTWLCDQLLARDVHPMAVNALINRIGPKLLAGGDNWTLVQRIFRDFEDGKLVPRTMGPEPGWAPCRDPGYRQ
jgi:hypothetical protein